MRITTLLTGLILLALAAPASADPAAVRRDVEAANKALVAAFDKGDLAGVARLYTDDARIIGPGGKPVSGRKAIDAYWTGIKQGRSWKLEVLDVGGGPQEPWQLGRSTLVTGPQGQERTSVVDFLVVWKRQPDGKLKIYIDMYVPAPKP